jgi:hypothetical protein
MGQVHRIDFASPVRKRIEGAAALERIVALQSLRELCKMHALAVFFGNEVR